MYQKHVTDLNRKLVEDQGVVLSHRTDRQPLIPRKEGIRPWTRCPKMLRGCSCEVSQLKVHTIQMGERVDAGRQRHQC